MHSASEARRRRREFRARIWVESKIFSLPDPKGLWALVLGFKAECLVYQLLHGLWIWTWASWSKRRSPRRRSPNRPKLKKLLIVPGASVHHVDQISTCLRSIPNFNILIQIASFFFSFPFLFFSFLFFFENALWWRIEMKARLTRCSAQHKQMDQVWIITFLLTVRISTKINSLQTKNILGPWLLS